MFVSQKESIMLDSATNALLKYINEMRIDCWLDSGTLLGVCRDGHPPSWDKDIDLGAWIEDIDGLRKIVTQFASEWGFRVLEKWLDGQPYAIILYPKKVFMRRPDWLWVEKHMIPISLHFFKKNGDWATSPQPHNLLSSRDYPLTVSGFSKRLNFNKAREDLNNISIVSRLRMVLILCFSVFGIRWIFMRYINSHRKNKLNLEARHPMEYSLTRLFFEKFEWVVPAKYFSNIMPFPGAAEFIKVPKDFEAYLTERYGNWHIPNQNWNYTLHDGLLRKSRN